MHKDIIVVGAGISGIAAGYNLQKSCPNKSFAILEGRSSLGGTWDLFKYPGVRSDSDMHTLGFSFKPWNHKKSIATGPLIMEYLEETIEEYGLNEKIKYKIFDNSTSYASLSHILFEQLEQKPCIFRMRFLIDFRKAWGEFWESFGRGLGTPWRLLGHF